ncbi:type III PLP-dependent enzyme [Dulcicalothrix desertica]|nr:type III PLP-dependent enzyme [Dulcicalothrix desertica]
MNQEYFPHFSDVRSLVKTLQPNYPVYCVRPKFIQQTAENFISQFAGTVMYAVKCNPHPLVLNALSSGGIKQFDVASQSEIAQIFNTYRTSPHFMHPVKNREAIRIAYFKYGVRYYAVDHLDELEKIVQEIGTDPNVVIVTRVKTPESDSCLYHLAKKFGAEPEEAAKLMQTTEKYGLKAGITFHVGSQCTDPKLYGKALNIVGEVLDYANIEPTCVDVGGGFPAAYPGTKVAPLEKYMLEIKNGLDRINLASSVQILAEPGRALVASGCSLIVQVLLRKSNQLYINDGIFGALSELLDSETVLLSQLIRPDDSVSDELEEFSICGVTCDSTDMIPCNFKLPKDVREGDWIEIDQVGAYSNALSTRFNGFYSKSFACVYDEPMSVCSSKNKNKNKNNFSRQKNKLKQIKEMKEICI